MLATARQMYSTSPATEQPPLNPQLSYLRVTINERVAFLVLGYVDTSSDGPVEVWYSGSGEVVRMRHGRVVGTTGLSTDWRAVRFRDEPTWSSTTREPGSQRFHRERDLMPGYRAGIRDEVMQAPIQPPASSALLGRPANSLRWVEERSQTLPASAALPPARFALAQINGNTEVVYSEQCLSSELCLSFERWNPSAPSTATSASPGA